MKKVIVNKELESKLTRKELAIWRQVKPNSGVLFMKGEIGIGKSAVCFSISQKLDMKYVYLALPTLDETDIGGVPSKGIHPITNLPYSQTLLPEWLVDAISSDKPVLIVMEELNRCNSYVRDAALGVINERRVANVQIPDHVFIIATGNVGDNYDGEVNELGLAMNNRLIHYKFTMLFKEWKEAFATENVHPLIMKYLEGRPQDLHFMGHSGKKSTEDDLVVVNTHRSWTNFSKYLTSNELTEVRDILEASRESAFGYIGNVAAEFISFLEKLETITYKDILNNYDKHEAEIKSFAQPELCRFLEDFKSRENVDLTKLTAKQYDNFGKFLNRFTADIRGGFIKELMSIAMKLKKEDIDISSLVNFIKRPEFKESAISIVGVLKSNDVEAVKAD